MWSTDGGGVNGGGGGEKLVESGVGDEEEGESEEDDESERGNSHFSEREFVWRILGKSRKIIERERKRMGFYL